MPCLVIDLNFIYLSTFRFSRQMSDRRPLIKSASCLQDLATCCKNAYGLRDLTAKSASDLWDLTVKSVSRLWDLTVKSASGLWDLTAKSASGFWDLTKRCCTFCLILISTGQSRVKFPLSASVSF